MEDYEEIEQFNELRTKLDERAGKIGLYLHDFQAYKAVETTDNGEGITHGKQVVTTFLIGDRAWSEKVQNPTKYAEEREMQAILDTLDIDSEIETYHALRKIADGE